MKRMRFTWLGLLLLLAGCAVVTVNVYFPEEDVRMAYDQMEDEFMRQAATPPAAPAPAPAPAPAATPAPGPQSAVPSFSLLATAAHAAPALEMTRTMAEIMAVMRKMPEVVAAYQARGQRQAVIRGLLDLGVLGLTTDGLVAVLPANYRPADALTKARDLLLITNPSVTSDSATQQYVRNWIQQMVAAECTDRNTIVTGMGRAMLKLLSDENPDAIQQDPTLQASMERQARTSFADREIERAPGIWWIQLPDNNWAVKTPPPPAEPSAPTGN